MGKLFLSGGGDGHQTVLVDKVFAGEVDKNKWVLYIPIAREPEVNSPPLINLSV